MAFEYERTVAAFLPPHRPNVRQRRSSCRCWTDSAWSAAYPVCFPICMRQIRHGSRLPAPCRTAFCRMETARSFIFRTIWLPQLLSGALSGRPSWVYYPNGLKKLKAHDEASQVSYLETLRVYLDNNLSVTRTAAALYLHRSTLLDRLAHITQMLGPRSEGSGFLPDARHSAPCGAAAETAGSTEDIISFPLRASRREYIWLQCRSSTIIPERAAEMTAMPTVPNTLAACILRQ